MTKANRDKIIAQRVAARLMGKNIFLKGDIVKAKGNAMPFPRQYKLAIIAEVDCTR
jgi:hypothetical protein